MMTTNHHYVVVSSFNYLAPITNNQYRTLSNTSRQTRMASSLLSSPTSIHKKRQAPRIYSSMNGVQQQNIDTTYDINNNNNNNDGDENQNKKRVPVTIRYSTESGMKPYYLTVAKRLKDLYPDVVIEPIEVKSFDGFKTAKSNTGNGSSTRSVGGGSNGNGQEKVDENMASTIFEVIIDEKTIIRKTIRANTHDNSGSIFVKMSKIEMAVTHARKRRRPGTATVYSENSEATSTSSGGTTSTINLQDQDQLLVKSRFENLKNKSSELQQLKKKEMKNFNNGGNSGEKTSGSNGSSVSNIGFE